MLQLRLHADPGVYDAAGLQLPLRGRAALLVALAVLQPGIRRAEVAERLWPEADSPRNNLRQQLARFRKVLGRDLLEGDDALHLSRAVRVAEPIAGAELLAGEQPEDDVLASWLQTERERDRAQRRTPLREALARAEAEGDLDAALALASRLVALDGEADEAAQAALMRVHYLRGEADAGLAAWRRLSAALQRHGSAPAAATRELALALERRGAITPLHNPAGGPVATPPGTPVAAALPATLQRPPRLVGRDAEAAGARRALAEGLAVLIEGEAGLGKSRLLAELLDAIGAGALTAASTSASASGPAPGPAPVLRAAGRPGDAGSPFATLARLLQPLGPAPDLPSATAPGVRQAALAALLDEHAVRTVVLDDLHFADEATLELLAGLAAADGTGRHWLFAQRPAEAPAAAQALRDGLLEQRRLVVLRLAPLDTEAAAALVDGLGIGGLDGPRIATALVRHTGGNPLFVLETLKQGLLDGSLARGHLPRPGSVGALIELRLQRLGERALTLARVAAVAGVDFGVELAEEAIGVRAVELAGAWDELQTAQVLRDEAFAHDLVAEAVLRGIPGAVARRMHAQCAQWLEQRDGEPARRARHWQQAGQFERAAQAFVQAAARARLAARQIEEAGLQAAAADCFGRAGRPEQRFEALAARVAALIGAQADASALAEARALEGEAGTDLQRVRALRVLADLVGQRGPFDEALAIGQAAIELARRIGAHEELVRVASMTAGNLCKLGRADEAYSLLLPLREHVDTLADDGLRSIWYGYWAAALGHMGRLREGVASYDVSIDCARRNGDLPLLGMAMVNQSIVLRTMGALGRARERTLGALALTAGDDDDAQHRLLRLAHARNAAESGEFAAALQALEALLPRLEGMDTPFWSWAARGTLARLWQHLGQHARALQVLRDPPAALPPWMHAGLHWARLEVDQWRGEPAAADLVGQARGLLQADPYRRAANEVRGLRFAEPAAVLTQAPELVATARGHEMFGVLAALHLHVARAAAALGRLDEAAAAATELGSLMAEGYAPDAVYLPEAGLVRTRVWRATGDPSAAAAALDDAMGWVRQQALPQVPAPFVDSFLRRNPVNEALLRLAGEASNAA
jgi:DNA-binding SARP family transcriptional activator